MNISFPLNSWLMQFPLYQKRKKKKDEEHVNKEIISQNEEHDNNIDWDVVSPNDKYDKKNILAYM